MINASTSTLPLIDITRKFYAKDQILEVTVTNKNLHWSVTGTLQKRTSRGFVETVSGAILNIIEDILGDSIKPLTSMHLSCAKTGVPMHSFGNGLYWLAGCFPEHGFNQKYHGGNGIWHKTSEECFKILCDHFRINENEANELKAECLNAWNSCSGKNEAEFLGNLAVRQVLRNFCNRMEPRWQAENDFLLNGGVDKIFNIVYEEFNRAQ
jgi:hypothetical protein